jgi:hypothetical protein
MKSLWKRLSQYMTPCVGQDSRLTGDKASSRDSTGPRKWQADIMGAISSHLREPGTRHQPCRIAVSSGHGIGKSALVGMLIHWGLSTAVDTKVIVTANTADQLDTKTVPETSKWFRRAINSHWWDVKSKSIKVLDEKLSKSWRCDFLPWSEDRPEAFAGAHNQGKRIVLVFDESSAIADIIWEVAEGALSDADTEIIWLAFGNPTRNTGRFRECFGKYAHRWTTFQIDSRTVEGTNRAYQQQLLEDNGEDSDYFRVRVRGEFPRAGFNQFIPSDIVAAARKHRAEGFESLPKILAVDVARYGDDQSVIGLRQGRLFQILARYRGLSTVQLAERTIEFIEKNAPDAWIIDGIGVGAGVVDQLEIRGYRRKMFEYNPSRGADDPAKYGNRRAEIWGLMRDWLASGAQIPDKPEMEEDLTGPEYYFNNKSQIMLESKEDMKARGLRSPDAGDCLAMTFDVKVLAPPKEDPLPEYILGPPRHNWMS